MKYVRVYPEHGEPYWKDGVEPAPKEIGVTAAIGIPFANYVKEYEAHPEKHPTGEDNIRYCEHKFRCSRDDDKKIERPKRFF